MLAVLGIPAIDRCDDDGPGLIECLRNQVDEKFDLGLEPSPAAVPEPQLPPEDRLIATEPVPVEAAAAVEPAPARIVVEASRSIAPQLADKPSPPVVTPPKVIAAPPLVPEPDEPVTPEAPPVVDLPVPAGSGGDPAETFALTTLPEPAVPRFVPPLPPAVDDVIPDPTTPPLDEMQPGAADAAPVVIPPAPSLTIDGVPPELQGDAMTSEEPSVVPEPAQDFVQSETPSLPIAPSPDTALADVPPLMPDDPALPTAEVEDIPPDLTIAAVDAVTLDAPVAPAWVSPDPASPTESVTPDPQGHLAADPSVVPDTTADLAPADTPTPPAAPPPDTTVAAIDPVVPAEAPLPAPPDLAPSIDAIEIDGEGNFIAGNGPAGAIMRLYVDGIPAGVSPVEGGRWLVEGTNILTEEQQRLEVEAIDPVTGKVLGTATVVFEGPLGPGPPQPATEQAVPDVDAPEVPAIPEPVQPEAILEPPVVPPIAPVVPAGESASVTILGSSGDTAIATLATGDTSDEVVVTLGSTPKSPAVVAHFTLPPPVNAADVTVLRAIPIGDPGAGRFVSGKAIIRRGDTLWDIAHRYYGSGIRYRTIFRANRELIARPGRIYPGQVFELPLVYDD